MYNNIGQLNVKGGVVMNDLAKNYKIDLIIEEVSDEINVVIGGSFSGSCSTSTSCGSTSTSTTC